MRKQNERMRYFRTQAFDNSRAYRWLPFKGIHCWAVKEQDVYLFLEQYPEMKEIKVKENDIIFSFSYKWANIFVCEEDSFCLEYPWKKMINSLIPKARPVVWVDDDLEGEFPYPIGHFENEYQCIIVKKNKGGKK